MGAFIDLTGKVFNKLTVLYRDKEHKKGKHISAFWICRCSCGVVKSISSNCLRAGTIKSCGCLKIETAIKNSPFTFLGGIIQQYSSEYATWIDIKSRCYNKNNKSYSYYGGSGIEVCSRWKNAFRCFLEDMGPRPKGRYSIERTNNTKGYTPENCKWSTHWEQMANTRKTVFYNYDGEIIHQRALARKLNVSHRTIGRNYSKFRIN